jgi:capsular exopolysaccharide synthesis family protein
LEKTSFADDPQSASSGGGKVSIDYRRILFHAFRFWYLVLLSLLTGLVSAYMINRYATRIYPVTASMIIRESAENADAKFLYNNPLVNTYRNYFNEIYIIRSYPLITSVVEDLNFHVRIVKEGDIKTTEQYNLVPVDVELVSKERSMSLRLELLGGSRYRCVNTSDENAKEFYMNDTVDYQGTKFVVTPRQGETIRKGEKYLVQFLDPVNIAGSYISKLRVTWAAQGSSLLNLDINGPIAQKEIDFLNKLIDYYQRYDLEKKNLAASRSLAFINGQLKEIGDSLKIFETAMENFKKQNFVTDLTTEAQSLYEELKVLSEQHAALKFTKNYYDYLNTYLKKSEGLDQVILPVSIGVEDQVLNTMVNKMIDIQIEMNGLALLRPQNDMMKQKVEVLRASLGDVKGQIMEAVSNVRSTDDIKLRGLRQQIESLERKLRGLPGVERRLINIQRNYTLSENLYIYLLQKRAEAGISRASTTTDIVPVNPPRQAGGPITPKVLQNYALWGGAGLILPFLIFVLMEVLNTRIQSREDVERITSIPFLGGIGHKETDSNLVVYEKPKSAIAESFRALRSNLNYFTANKDRKVFMITSSVSGEGKTFTTINLATVLALSGKKTIIIGADLRKPRLYNDFNLTNDAGLSTYLSGMHSIEQIIQQTGVAHLDLISGGPVPPNPSELILSNRMDELMTELVKRYEFVLLDTPPLALITDGLVLSKYVDHTIYLIRQNYTPKGMLATVEEMYQTGKLRNISLVLNDVYRSGPGYGYGHYGYGAYGYGYGYVYGEKKGDSTGYYSD